jgi:hypothetical protein
MKRPLSCKGCDHYEKAFCKLYGSIIHDHNPITRCHKRKGK